MMYDRQLNKYYLFVPEKIEPTKIKKKRKIIACDPGIRTFMTGISGNYVVKIGDKCSKRIKECLKIIDKRTNMNIPNKIKKKNEKLYNRKISGLVDELHWKTIKYLTSTYKRILIGDMSVKGITSKICSMCGYIKNNLGSSKKYDCDGCNVSIDRDVNGARGIFIKSLYL